MRRDRASPPKQGKRQEDIDVPSLHRQSLQNGQCFHNLYAYLSAARNKVESPASRFGIVIEVELVGRRFVVAGVGFGLQTWLQVFVGRSGEEERWNETELIVRDLFVDENVDMCQCLVAVFLGPRPLLAGWAGVDSEGRRGLPCCGSYQR